MGIAQIALDPLLRKQANVEKKVPQTILASRYTPRQRGKKGPKQSWQAFTSCKLQPPPLYGQCPCGNNTFQKGPSLRGDFLRKTAVSLDFVQITNPPPPSPILDKLYNFF